MSVVGFHEIAMGPMINPFEELHPFSWAAIGCRRFDITEVLQQLQHQGLIRYGQGKITVLNRSGLAGR
jgi:hypothetical protein